MTSESSDQRGIAWCVLHDVGLTPEGECWSKIWEENHSPFRGVDPDFICVLSLEGDPRHRWWIDVDTHGLHKRGEELDDDV